MKVTYCSVLAQHPLGLDIHVRNVQWAFPEAEIHIFTHGAWQLHHPDIHLHKTTADPWTYYPFWQKKITPFIRCHDADIFVFKQHDMLFHQRPSINGVVLNNEHYQPPIKSGEKTVYPYLWEGGLVIPGTLLKEAIETGGIDLGNRVFSPYLLERLKADKLLEINGKRLAAIERGQSIEHFCQLTLYCFLNQTPIQQQSFICHFHQLEAIHRKFPDLYDRKFDADFLRQLGRSANAAQIVFFLRLSQAIKSSSDINHVLRNHPKLKTTIRLLASHVNEWMSSEQLDEFRKLERLIEGVLL